MKPGLKHNSPDDDVVGNHDASNLCAHDHLKDNMRAKFQSTDCCGVGDDLSNQLSDVILCGSDLLSQEEWT